MNHLDHAEVYSHTAESEMYATKQPVIKAETRDDGEKVPYLVFGVTCAECGKGTSTGLARAMREHADGLYAFICRRATCKEAAQ